MNNVETNDTNVLDSTDFPLSECIALASGPQSLLHKFIISRKAFLGLSTTAVVTAVTPTIEKIPDKHHARRF